MKFQDTPRALWAWIRGRQEDTITINRKPITDTYGEKAIQWTAKAGKDELKFVTKPSRQ